MTATNRQSGDAAGGCPVYNGAARALPGRTNKDWWPEALPGLSAPAMAVLVAGLRVLGANRVGMLSNNFFVHVLDMGTAWSAAAEVYAEAGKNEKFVRDFIGAWTKVKNGDRLGLR